MLNFIMSFFQNGGGGVNVERKENPYENLNLHLREHHSCPNVRFLNLCKWIFLADCEHLNREVWESHSRRIQNLTKCGMDGRNNGKCRNIGKCLPSCNESRNFVFRVYRHCRNRWEDLFATFGESRGKCVSRRNLFLDNVIATERGWSCA